MNFNEKINNVLRYYKGNISPQNFSEHENLKAAVQSSDSLQQEFLEILGEEYETSKKRDSARTAHIPYFTYYKKDETSLIGANIQFGFFFQNFDYNLYPIIRPCFYLALVIDKNNFQKRIKNKDYLNTEDRADAQRYSNYLKNKIININNYGFVKEGIDLDSKNDPTPIHNKGQHMDFEAVTLLSKEYKFDNIPNEETIKKDFLEMEKIYSNLCQTIVDEFGSFEEFISSGLKPLVNDEKNREPNSVKPDTGYNKIYYGLPGCGKSYKVKKELEDKKVDDSNIIRVTFHQDYSYSDFIGQIMPVVETIKEKTSHKEEIIKEVLKYKFQPGPFVNAIEKALGRTEENVYLIIEEINRGNAPAIFGDTFQLLDRVDDEGKGKLGESEFPITNNQVAKYLYKDDKKMYIPSNLIILATMNTSDQNVFTLDTAFKRRWEFEEVTNSFETHEYKDYLIPFKDSKMTWEMFVEGINSEIVKNQNTHVAFEDKRIGAYFIQKKDLLDPAAELKEDELEKASKRFAYKMLEYLWNDVSKFRKELLFEKYDTLSELIEDFIGSKGIKVFKIFDNE